MDYQLVRNQSVEFMLQRGWKEKGAKRGKFEQSLFDHTMIEVDAFITLLPLLRATFSPPLTEQEEQVLLTSAIAHDVGKELDEWQKYLQGERGFLSDVNRELAEKIVPQLATLFDFTGVEEMLSGVLLHMRHERTPAKVMDRVLFSGHANERWKTLADLVDDIDNLCSIRGLLNAVEYLEKQSKISKHIQIAYHLVQLRGVSTTLLHRAAIDSYIAQGWSPLIHYSDGTIYVASATAEIQEPKIGEIETSFAEGIKAALPENIAKLIVGSPLQAMMPKPDLFDYRDLRACLQVAARKINRANFFKKSEPDRLKVVGSYFKFKGDDASISAKLLARETERIGIAQPEMCIFKFFKASLAAELIGSEVTSEAQDAYVGFAESEGKKKVAKITPQSVARAEYDKVFGVGAYADLQKTSTLMPAKEMALNIDRFWGLNGKHFGLEVSRIEYLLDHAKREDFLIDTLVEIANKVYSAIPQENLPTRSTSKQIAKCFIPDLIRPTMEVNLAELAKQQMDAYATTKGNARRDKGMHLCPICNATFEGGTVAKADFLANPESHTNRGVSHGNAGYIVICDACKFERFLQQLILGTKVADVIVLLPRMNIGHSSGETLRQKAVQIWEIALTRMSEANPDPDQHLSLGMTYNLAQKLKDVDVFRLSPTEIVNLMTYESGKDTKKKHREELEDNLKKIYEVDKLDIQILNDNWNSNYGSVEQAIEALIENKETDDDARKARAEAFRLTPQFHIVCQTPHMILVPLTNQISMNDKESDTNAGLRELYVTLVLGLSLDCSVAVIKAGEIITFEGGEGIARVPSVPALRDLIGAEWIGVADAKKWLNAIGAAAMLANATAFPERSNLYAILKSPTAGHILRRIEQKSDTGHVSANQLYLLETIKEVLQ